MFLDYISLPVFLASFAVGLFFIYALGPDEKIIYIYPTLNNYHDIQYKDSMNECFEYKPLVTKCPVNPLDIKTIPPQV